MYMRACLLSVMTFREQRVRNPAIPPAGRLRKQRRLHRRRLRPHRHLRQIRPFRRSHCRRRHCPQRRCRLKHHRSHHSLRLLYSLRIRQRQHPPRHSRRPEPQKGTARPFRPHSPAHQPDRASADGTGPGWAEPQGILQEAVDFSSEFIDKWKKPFYNALNASGDYS